MPDQTIDYERLKLPPPNWWKTAPTVAETNGHDWIQDWTGKYQCCRRCCIVRRADDKNKECPRTMGKISLR